MRYQRPYHRYNTDTGDVWMPIPSMSSSIETIPKNGMKPFAVQIFLITVSNDNQLCLSLFSRNIFCIIFVCVDLMTCSQRLNLKLTLWILLEICIIRCWFCFDCCFKARFLKHFLCRCILS